MNKKSTHFNSTIFKLNEIYRKQYADGKGVSQLEIENIIYQNQTKPSLSDSIIRQINRYNRGIEMQFNCRINKCKNNTYRLTPTRKKDKEYQKKEHERKIELSINLNKKGDINIIKLIQYESKKGLKNYAIIGMDLIISIDSYFKGYIVNIDPYNNELSLLEPKLKRFNISNIQIINIDINKIFNNINPSLAEKINLYGSLEIDDFGFAVKYGTNSSTVSIYVTEYLKNHIKKFFSKIKESKVELKKIKKKIIGEDGLEYIYETDIKYNNIKNFFLLFFPYFAQIRFKNQNDFTIVKQQLIQYINNNLKQA